MYFNMYLKHATEYHRYFDFYIHIFKKKILCLLFSRFSFFYIIIIEFQHQTNCKIWRGWHSSHRNVIKEIIENIQIVRGWSFSCLQWRKLVGRKYLISLNNLYNIYILYIILFLFIDTTLFTSYLTSTITYLQDR